MRHDRRAASRRRAARQAATANHDRPACRVQWHGSAATTRPGTAVRRIPRLASTSGTRLQAGREARCSGSKDGLPNSDGAPPKPTADKRPGRPGVVLPQSFRPGLPADLIRSTTAFWPGLGRPAASQVYLRLTDGPSPTRFPMSTSSARASQSFEVFRSRLAGSRGGRCSHPRSTDHPRCCEQTQRPALKFEVEGPFSSRQ